MTTLEKIRAEIEQERVDEDWDIGQEIYYNNAIDDILQIIDKYAEQEPKAGHWILADEQDKEDVENDNYRFICSECQCSDIHAKWTKVPYCWKCGAKMVESQESEDKE